MVQNYEKKIAALKETFVSHAEIEFLWDKRKKYQGFIDPNALSAGGFPFVFRTILEQIELQASVSENEKVILQESLQIAFPQLAAKEVMILLQKVLPILEKMAFVSNEEVRELANSLKEKAALLRSLYAKDFFKRILMLFSTEYGIAWVCPPAWREYRLNKIREFLRLVKSRTGFYYFPADVMSQVKLYLDTHVSTIKDISGPAYSTFDVEWESDFSYYLVETKKLKDTQIQVLIDLHANTGLFSEIPLKAILAPYGSTNYMEIYRLLVSAVPEVTGKTISLRNDKCSIVIQENGKKIINLPNGGKVDVLKVVYTAGEAITEHFKQYAYLWQWFNKTYFSLQNESHRKMYLSSLLNAKNTFFKILMAERDSDVSIPVTAILPNGAHTDTTAFGSTVMIKDGGWCSTGGKHVHRIAKTDIESQLKELPYEGFLVQNYAPSILFSQRGIKYHGHIRKASVIDSNGKIAHAGYVLKLIEQERGNSSGYKSHMMYFSEEGKFIFGKEIGTSSPIYTTLGSQEFAIEVPMEKVLSVAKEEWLKAMYIVNKFIGEVDIKTFVQEMVKDKVLSAQYLLN